MTKNQNYSPGVIASDIEGERKVRYMRRRFSALHEQGDRPGYRERQAKRFKVLSHFLACEATGPDWIRDVDYNPVAVAKFMEGRGPI